jgi:hypothetical protein
VILRIENVVEVNVSIHNFRKCSAKLWTVWYDLFQCEQVCVAKDHNRSFQIIQDMSA